MVGATSVTFLTTGNSTVQLAVEPAVGGRVTALWSTAFVGTTPIGSPILGAITQEAPEHRIRAASAMTSFTNTLAVSLFTLIEGQRSGAPAGPSSACRS